MLRTPLSTFSTFSSSSVSRAHLCTSQLSRSTASPTPLFARSFIDSRSPPSRPNVLGNLTTSTVLQPTWPRIASRRASARLLTPNHHLLRACSTHAVMAGGPTGAVKPAEEYRLPTDIKAKHYDLTVRTDLEKLKFDGYVVAQYVMIEFSRSSAECYTKPRCTQRHVQGRLQQLKTRIGTRDVLFCCIERRTYRPCK